MISSRCLITIALLSKIVWEQHPRTHHKEAMLQAQYLAPLWCVLGCCSQTILLNKAPGPAPGSGEPCWIWALASHSPKIYFFFVKNLNMHCILIWQICKNMHPPLCWWCQCASLLQVGVGLTRMAATPSRRRSAVAPSVAEAMEAGFLPALDEDQHRTCACSNTLSITGF